MADLDRYKEKFDERGVAVLEEALKKSEESGKNWLSVPLVIDALSVREEEVFNTFLHKLSVEPAKVKGINLRHLALAKKHRGKGFGIAPAVTDLFKRAMDRARSEGRWQINSADIFINLAEDKTSLLNDILSEFDCEPEEVALSVRFALRKSAESSSSAAKDVQQIKPIYSELSEAVSKRVFVVHGQDEFAKMKVARFLENLELDAVILHEQASGSSTIIEKLERFSDVNYAVILLTPDDVGALESSLPEKGGQIRKSLSLRARQNVIFELGFFIGKLGRARVCALYSGKIELPTDYAGVVYVSMDENDAWKQIIARELEAAGLNINHKGLLK